MSHMTWTLCSHAVSTACEYVSKTHLISSLRAACALPRQHGSMQKVRSKAYDMNHVTLKIFVSLKLCLCCVVLCCVVLCPGYFDVKYQRVGTVDVVHPISHLDLPSGKDPTKFISKSAPVSRL